MPPIIIADRLRSLRPVMLAQSQSLWHVITRILGHSYQEPLCAVKSSLQTAVLTFACACLPASQPVSHPVRVWVDVPLKQPLVSHTVMVTKAWVGANKLSLRITSQLSWVVCLSLAASC